MEKPPVDKAIQREIQDLMKNDAFVLQQAELLGFTADSASVTFPK